MLELLRSNIGQSQEAVLIHFYLYVAYDLSRVKQLKLKYFDERKTGQTGQYSVVPQSVLLTHHKFF